MFYKQISLLCILFSLGSTVSLADTIRVPQDYPTIQQAINASSDGDEIIVSPGFYMENLDFVNKDIVVRSIDPTDPEIVVATYIQGGGIARVATLSTGKLSGFKISFGNGGIRAGGTAIVSFNLVVSNASTENGAGIYAEATALVYKNIIEENICVADTMGGGGVFATGSSVISDNLIRNNHASHSENGGLGGGIFASGEVQVWNNVIESNSATRGGGGIALAGQSVASENLVQDNTTNRVGGGILLLDTSEAHDNLIILNSGRDGAGANTQDQSILFYNIVRTNRGDGIYASDLSRVSNNQVLNNQGVGIFAGGRSHIIENHIEGNHSDTSGGGIRCDGDAVVMNNVIVRNSSSTGGGAFIMGRCIFISNLLMENTADVGGGAFCWGSDGLILFRNNTVVNNTGREAGGNVYVDNRTEVKNNIIVFALIGTELHVRENAVGASADYNCIENASGPRFGGIAQEIVEQGTGNILEDPLFQLDHIHLRRVSPCINAGDPDLTPISGEKDIDGEMRIQNGRVEIGVDEFRNPQNTTELFDFQIVVGNLVSGGIPEMSTSDDQFVQTLSGFGERFSESHLLEMQVQAVSLVESASRIRIALESYISDSRGLATISFRNWATGEFEQIGQYSIGLNEETITFEDIDAKNYIRVSGVIELSIKHVVFVPFLAFQFGSFFDLVEITVE